MAGTSTSRVVRVLDHEYSAGVGLVVGVAVALTWSAVASSSYFTIFASRSNTRFFKFLEVTSVHDVVVNLLMAVFFLAMGLELSRELASGLLTQPKHSIPPVLGAVGGMLVTALGSLLLGSLLHSAALRRGWGVPMATDVAFTLGVLAVVGKRLPPTLRIFLLTLAITDDVLSVIVLSVSGTTHVRALGLLAIVVATIAGRALMRRSSHLIAGVGVFVALWICFAWANVEPALAGVLAGVLIPSRSLSGQRLELVATRLSVGVVLPLFAVVACGLHWSHVQLNGAVGTVVVATIAVRLVGKTLGITGGVALARLLSFRPPSSITWPLIVSSALLCAIGFTVPLLFATKLFGAQSSLYAGYTLGLLISSAVAAIVGGVLLRLQHSSV